jgi:sugar phosphate isomerase/epimerase
MAPFLLSTDTLSGYGLDLIFKTAQKVGFEGLDLAIRKNFDAWHNSYVKDLIQEYNMPIKNIQLSRNTNIKEMNQAVDLANDLGASSISINAPGIMNIKTFRFLSTNLPAYKAHNKDLKFSIINPETTNYLGIIPKFYFSNQAEIIKKYGLYLGLDIANMDEYSLENQFMKKLAIYTPYLTTVYLSDVGKAGDTHLPLGDGVLKLPQMLKKFKQLEFDGGFALKLRIDPHDLADIEKVELILKKCKTYFTENYTLASVG